MKIAVTGAHGFLGKAVLKKLRAKKISYSILDRKKHDLFDPKTLKKLVRGKKAVIHLAGANRAENIEIGKTNTLGTLSLLEAISQYAPKARVIFSSSFQVYLNENIYGISKKHSEDLISHYASKMGIKATIFRISNIYGPGGKPFYNSVIATLNHLIKTGQPLKINGDGFQTRDFIFVEDVADAIVRAILIKKQKPFEIFDICSGKETALNEVLQLIKELSGKNFTVEYNRKIKEIPWPTKGKNFKLAKEILKWQPVTSLKEGLKKLVEHG